MFDGSERNNRWLPAIRHREAAGLVAQMEQEIVFDEFRETAAATPAATVACEATATSLPTPIWIGVMPLRPSSDIGPDGAASELTLQGSACPRDAPRPL